jgi:hypothetical protein
MKQLLMVMVLLSGLVMQTEVIAQTTGQTRQQRPVRNPPQYPNIISDGKTDPGKAQPHPDPSAQPIASADFVRVLESLAGEVKELVNEIRAMNVRQQAQLDMLRLTRGDGLEANLDRDHRTAAETVRELERSELSLIETLKPENLAIRASQVGTLDKDATIRQMKHDLEAELLKVQTHKAQMQAQELEIRQRLEAIRSKNENTERRLELVEDALRQLNAPRPAEEKKP